MALFVFKIVDIFILDLILSDDNPVKKRKPIKQKKEIEDTPG